MFSKCGIERTTDHIDRPRPLLLLLLLLLLMLEPPTLASSLFQHRARPIQWRIFLDID